MNCFGRLSRDSGQTRVPAPPHMMTGRILTFSRSLAKNTDSPLQNLFHAMDAGACIARRTIIDACAANVACFSVTVRKKDVYFGLDEKAIAFTRRSARNRNLPPFSNPIICYARVSIDG